jgi:putative membrane protein
VNILVSLLVWTLAVWVTAEALPGFHVAGRWGAVKVAALFGVLNWFLGHLLFVMIGLGTLGLGFVLGFITRWVVNAIVLKLVDAISDSLKIDSFKHALLGAGLISLVISATEWILKSVF